MILITGAAGHTGLLLLEELKNLNLNCRIRCLVRSNSPNIEKVKKYNVELVNGDIENCTALKEAMKDVETVIHIAGILYSDKIMASAQKAGVRRIIFIHTTGIYSKYRECVKAYKSVEELIFRDCKVDYIILRPTMIYGSTMDHNMHKLIQYIKIHRFFPVFGSGKSLMQPVHALDLAKAIVSVLTNNKISNKAYNISGKTVISYRDILNQISQRVNPRIKFIYIPYRISLLLGMAYGFLFKLLNKNPSISVEQINRLSENKSYSFKDAAEDFGYNPISFEEGINKEIDLMK